MYEFLEILAVLDILFHNFTFGVLWTSLGMIIVLSTLVIVNSGKGVKVVKFIGFTAAIFFLAPGLIALVMSVRQIL